MLRADYSGEEPEFYIDGERVTQEIASDELDRLGFPQELV
jgi:hypothetical protein